MRSDAFDIVSNAGCRIEVMWKGTDEVSRVVTF
jgi:hypothetical protein